MKFSRHETGGRIGGGDILHNLVFRDLPGRKNPKGLASPGLLVLDLMRLFCDFSSPAYVSAYSGIRDRLFELVDAMTKAGRPVLFTRHAHGADDNGGIIGRMHGRLQRMADPHNDLIEEARSRIPPAGVSFKCRHSPFGNGAAAEFFRGCDALLIAGVQTQACVLATAIDCDRLGLVPVVIADACASKSERLHREALEVMASGHAYVMNTEEARAHFSLKRRLP